MKRFISLLTVAAALMATTTLAASAVPALASPLSGGNLAMNSATYSWIEDGRKSCP